MSKKELEAFTREAALNIGLDHHPAPIPIFTVPARLNLSCLNHHLRTFCLCSSLS